MADGRSVARRRVLSATQALLWGSVAAAAAAWARTGDAAMSDGAAARLHCTGRFAFSAPEAMLVAGRSQSIYRTKIGSAPIPTEGAEAVWKARLAAAQAAGGTSQRNLALQPGASAAWYVRSAAYPNILTLTAMQVAGAHLLTIERDADAGREATAETLVKEILGAYQPATTSGFCIGAGAIMLRPSVNEQARLALGHAAQPDVELRFETRTVAQPDLTTHANLDEERQLAAANGGRLTVLGDAERTAAGLVGKEMRIALAVPGEAPVVRFTWHFAGVGASSTQPSVDIVGSARLEHQARLEAAWEAVLRSLRPVPPSPAAR